MGATMKLRRGNSDLWAGVNPILSDGEQGYETDTGFIKVGDGVTAWNDLSYYLGEGAVFDAGGPDTPADMTIDGGTF